MLARCSPKDGASSRGTCALSEVFNKQPTFGRLAGFEAEVWFTLGIGRASSWSEVTLSTSDSAVTSRGRLGLGAGERPSSSSRLSNNSRGRAGYAERAGVSTLCTAHACTELCLRLSEQGQRARVACFPRSRLLFELLSSQVLRLLLPSPPPTRYLAASSGSNAVRALQSSVVSPSNTLIFAPLRFPSPRHGSNTSGG